MTLRHIGYWRSEHSPEWPDVNAFVDADWDENDRYIVAQYLSSGTCVRRYRGWSYCRICDEQNGDSELSDGVYLWPDGLAHYVEAHAVWLPAEFVDHAITRMDALEADPVDDSWWASQLGP